VSSVVTAIGYQKLMYMGALPVFMLHEL